jgi:hypothetical protein
MEFRTVVDIEEPGFRIGPCEEMLFVGSCFADSIGQRFREEGFPVTVNPFGTMYNPASVLHTVERLLTPDSFKTVFLTLGTNHVYRLKETGEIVDNCQKRPQPLFTEEELSVDECADYLMRAIELLRQANPDVRIVLTVSPIRYRKYGYHGSQLSKATLLLATRQVTIKFKVQSSKFKVSYFPAYEILNDELRDYRFYKPDMLHPSEQTVDYIWERLVETYFSAEAKAFLQEWAPLKAVLHHKPFNPDSEDYRALMDKTMLKVVALQKKYPTFAP